jgi:hypothetical protein
MARVMMALSILGLFLTQSAYGLEQGQQNDLKIIKQYHYNLQRIPQNLTPEQKYILEQQFKNRMHYEIWKQHKAAAQATSPPKENAPNP